MYLLPTKLFSKTLRSLVNNSRKSSKRGVAEIIGAVLLLAITISAGLLVFVLVNGSESLNFVIAEQGSINPNVIPKLKLSGYDTRDAENLYNLGDIDNQIGTSSSEPDHLCTTCSPNEFIILKVRNDGNIDVTITSISINEAEHVFDSDHTTTNQLFLSSTLPEAGEFIIISGTGTDGILQESRSSLPEGSEKRIVIRLSGDITPNDPDDKGIDLSSKIRVVINSSVETTQLLLVPAGRLA